LELDSLNTFFPAHFIKFLTLKDLVNLHNEPVPKLRIISSNIEFREIKLSINKENDFEILINSEKISYGMSSMIKIRI
jgi:hypothetical protein